MNKVYLDYVPTEEDIKFFGWLKDENGYYYEEPSEPQDTGKAWAEYWSQFSAEEIEKMIF